MPLPPLPLAPLLVPGTADEEVEGVLTPEPGKDAPVEPKTGVHSRGLNLCPMYAFIRTAAHWDAVGGRREVTDCDQNSVGFLHSVCVFLFLLATQTD